MKKSTSPASMPRPFLVSLFDAAVSAADPLQAIRAYLPQRPKGRTIVIGAGKGAAQMAHALEKLWDGPLEGTVVTRYGYECATDNIKILMASHPIPDKAGATAAEALFSQVRGLCEDDLVIALICGGGSALLPFPGAGLTLADEIRVNQILLASGAPISEMNVVRKHLSCIKGGRLAAATRAKVVSLIVSDVPGDNPAQVASGPTVPDNTTRHDALEIVARRKLALPRAAMASLASQTADAPRPDDPRFATHEHYVIASAGVSLRAAAECARRQGMAAAILSDSIEGEAKDVALVHAAIARQISASHDPLAAPVVLLSGGETSVTLAGASGRGGRNGEFALSLATAIDGMKTIFALAADTDGIDGTERNAGAFVDGTTVSRLISAGHDARQLLALHDSYSGFEALDDLFNTGPTGTNVNDFRAVLIL